MLREAELVAFVPTTNPKKARAFYETKLGLRFVSEDHFAIVFNSNGVTVRIANVSGVPHKPAAFTILGWTVPDIAETIRALDKKGVLFERYEGMDQDALGVWTSPSGAKVAWFKDPDGNVLSLTEIGA
jgi:catechol 2,3-dioxygenase-like lactoylglutathione lyase family enzyme